MKIEVLSMSLLLFYWFSSSVLGTTNVEIPFEAATTRAVVIMSLFYIFLLKF